MKKVNLICPMLTLGTASATRIFIAFSSVADLACACRGRTGRIVAAGAGLVLGRATDCHYFPESDRAEAGGQNGRQIQGRCDWQREVPSRSARIINVEVTVD